MCFRPEVNHVNSSHADFELDEKDIFQSREDVTPSRRKTKISPPTTPPDQHSTLAMKVPHDLPPKISPPRIDTIYSLPIMLTPTLPENIEDELLRLGSDSIPSSAEKKPKPSAHVTPEKTANTFAGPKSDIASKSGSQAAKKSIGARTVESKKQPPSFDAILPKGNTDEAVPLRSVEFLSPPKKKSSLIVRLKFRKSKMAIVQQILKLPPKPLGKGGKKLESGAKKGIEPVKDHIQAKPRTLIDEEMPKKFAEKRIRSEEDSATPEAVSKKAKIPPNAAADQERTPRTPSPPLSARSSVQKSQHQTPRKEQLRAVAMTRTASTESNDATPSRNPSTPAAIKNVGPTSAPGRSQTTVAWTVMTNKYLDLGKKLKHEARDILSKGVSSSSPEHKRAIVLNLECVLSFMLAYVGSDYVRRQDKKPGSLDWWRQLAMMWKGLRGQCIDYPHLFAFMWHLGTIICARIEAIISEQGIPKEATPSQETITNLTSSVENWEMLQRCSREAHSRLPIEDIISLYPKTWKSRGRGQRPAAWENIKPTDTKGSYHLPFGPDTTPVQAVRFGLVFLTEWMKGEGVDYELRLRL